MIPEFLNKFKEAIIAHQMETIRIKAVPLADNEQLEPRQSRFLGKPYLPIGYPYPKDKNGVPMIMLAQINFEEAPGLAGYPASGILQLFVSSTDWYDMEDYAVRYHEHTDATPETDFSFLTEALYEDSPIAGEHRLTFEKAIDYGDLNDHRFSLDFDGKDLYSYSNELSKPLQDELSAFFDSTGHKIGGYAYFTQSDPREYDKQKREDVLLLQIDSDNEQIMFGDVGVANVFIHPDDLRARNFDKAYFNWDCC